MDCQALRIGERAHRDGEAFERFALGDDIGAVGGRRQSLTFLGEAHGVVLVLVTSRCRSTALRADESGDLVEPRTEAAWIGETVEHSVGTDEDLLCGVF